MIFADLPSGAEVLIDANIWIFHFTAHAKLGAACTALVNRVEQRDFVRYTSTHVLTEVAHRLIC